jgi:hypothetical protein
MRDINGPIDKAVSPGCDRARGAVRWVSEVEAVKDRVLVGRKT